MLFNSIHFLIFFPIVVAIYFLLPQRFRWILLLAASYYFYMSWKMEYIILIIVSTLIDYTAGIMMGKTEDKGKRRKYLILSLFTNLGLLFAFKYFNFFNDSTRMLFQHFSLSYHVPYFNVLLPVGISFYTFQTLSYTIEVYRGHQKPEKHLGIFALYVSFFPQLVAGPIERSTNLLPQFYKNHSFNYTDVTDGLKLMIWGYFKKVVIADRVAILVNTVYSDPHSYSGIQLIIATVFFAFQIYCDFSAYSDIAIGAAQIMGYKLMDNFNRPYFSKTIAEFWKRWHISLSTWFRDYLYISLGGNRVSSKRHYFNLFITFLVSGLWHGANWTFIIWGGLNGLYLIVERLLHETSMKFHRITRIKRSSYPFRIFRIIINFSLVCFAWIFFRASSLKDAFYIIGHLFDGIPEFFRAVLSMNLEVIKGLMRGVGLTQREFIIAVLAILFMEFIHTIQRHGSIRHMLRGKPLLLRWLIYYVMIFSILFFGAFNTSQQFIYFQF